MGELQVGMLSGVDIFVNEPIFIFMRRKKVSAKITSPFLRKMSQDSGQNFSFLGV